MTRNASGFAKTTFGGKSGVYACRCCSRNTRQTAGDNDALDLCAQCYDLAGEENSLSDTGEFYQGAQWVLECIAKLATLKGANVSKWDDLKAAALAKLPAELPAPASGKVAALPVLATADIIGVESLLAEMRKFGKTIQSPTNRATFAKFVDTAEAECTTEDGIKRLIGITLCVPSVQRELGTNFKFINAYFQKFGI